jgi:predicted LPLAT superfamily acyltransferase
LENGRGVFLLASHLGNIELLRGLVSFNQTVVSRKVPLVVVFDINVSGNFSRMMKELNSQAVDIISTRDIGPHTAALLEEKLEAGGIVTITGDRTTANGTDKNFLFPFLGEEAPFPSGAFYLAALMKAPVYFVFSLRRKALSLRPEYDMHVRKSTLSLECSRKERFQKSSALAASFVSLLENYCKEQPFQWYNFYDFWSKEV